MYKKRKSIFKGIREAQELFHNQEFTRAFNLLGDIEKSTQNIHLKSKIANLRAQCLFQVGNIRAIIEYVEGLLTTYPLSGQMTFLAAIVYRKLGEHVKASRLYLRCVCLYPENTQYALAYAQFLKESNRLLESNRIIFKSLKKNRRKGKSPDSGLYFLYLELALNYHQLNHFSRALILFNYCAKKIKNFPFYDLIAEIYLKKNQYKKAFKNIILHIDNWGEGDPDALFIYAKTLVSLNRKKEALKQLQKCSQIWGEVVIKPEDMTHLFPLLQDGSLKEIHNLFIEL
jgi:tetratricopeptide (TPR) repeat protein